MCTLALYFQAIQDHPLVIAANRDEFLSRPSSSPEVLADSPWVFGGKDLLAGGTWLGINSNGMVVGILNRRSGPKKEKVGKRSRGLLCLDLLKAKDPSEARERLRQDEVNIYDPFNLVFANDIEAYIAHNAREVVEIVNLDPGVHVVSNVSIYDRSGGKTNHATALFADAARLITQGSFDRSPKETESRSNLRSPAQPSSIRLFRRILSDHRLSEGSSNPREAICVHAGEYGTVSSSILIYRANEKKFDFYHASGPPCRSDYERCTLYAGG